MLTGGGGVGWRRQGREVEQREVGRREVGSHGVSRATRGSAVRVRSCGVSQAVWGRAGGWGGRARGWSVGCARVSWAVGSK
jgi:hypothetical protein